MGATGISASSVSTLSAATTLSVSVTTFDPSAAPTPTPTPAKLKFVINTSSDDDGDSNALLYAILGCLVFMILLGAGIFMRLKSTAQQPVNPAMVVQTVQVQPPAGGVVTAPQTSVISYNQSGKATTRAATS